MYCPKCSQPLAVDENQFCSRCGLPLNELKEIVAGKTNRGKTRAGQSPPVKDKLSPRQKGLRHGAILMLLSVILIPAYVLLAALFPANERLVESAVSDTPFEKISEAILLTLFLLGVARVAYAWFFQQDTPQSLVSPGSPGELPPAQANPISGFGAWRASTGELVESEELRGKR